VRRGKQKRRWVWVCAAGMSLWGTFGLAQDGPTPAIPETNVEANDTPTVPDTVVEAPPFTPPSAPIDPGSFPQSQPPQQGDPISGLPYNPNLDPYLQGDMQDYPGGSILRGSVFSSGPARGYIAGESTAATLINTADGNIPGTVNSITRAVLNDQQALRFQDVIRNAGGVQLGGDGLFADRIFIRGIQLQSTDFRKDGFLDPTYVPRDFQNIERIEILKGPMSTLYGAGSPAGMVNLVTKKPMNAQFSNVGYQFGSYSRDRFTLDTNGLGTESGTVMYRINAAQEDTRTWRDFDSMTRTLVNPAITWAPDDYTALTYQCEYHKDFRLGDQGVPAINGNALALPPNRYVGEPANDFIHYQEFRQTLMLTRQITDDTVLRIGGSSLWYRFPGSLTQVSDSFFPPTTTPFGTFVGRDRNDIVKEDEETHSFIANVASVYDRGLFVHNTVVGMEYAYFDSNSQFNFGGLGSLVPFPPFVAPDVFNVDNPVYNNPGVIPFGSAFFPTYRQQRVGGYMQDLVELSSKWKALASIRFDTVDLTFDRTLAFGQNPPVQSRTEQTFNRYSPRGGLIFQPFEDERLSLYYVYSQAFSPPGGGAYLNPGGLRPVLGETHEVGVKTLLLPNLALNTAGFYTTRQNADLNTSSVFLIQVGQERSQGAEINLMGQMTDRWNVIGNYTYADVRLSDATFPAFDGKRQRGVPYNTMNVWSRYNVIQNETHIVGAAAGLIYLDQRPGDLANTFNLPAYSRWDAGMYYTRGRFNGGVYLENLFDKQYAASSINQFQVFPGAPFNCRAMGSIVF
jgi:iron complex outermembrane receptor protein